MGFFERDNLRFNYDEFGSGIPFIFSHGLGGNLAPVRDLIEPLANVRAIIYDNRGHGLTSGAGDPAKLTFASMADDMAAALDYARVNTAVIGGESMGAGISLALWRRHPERVRALILSRPAWLNTPFPPSLAILATMARMIDEFGGEQAPMRMAQSREFLQLSSAHPETAKSLMRVLEGSAKSPLSLIYRTIPASVPFDRYEDLGGIGVPTLVLASHDDPLHPFECAERLSAAIPRATLRSIPSKNESVERHREAFRLQVSEFIASLKSR